MSTIDQERKAVLAQLRPVVKRLGRFPKVREVRALPDGWKLDKAIGEVGGYRALAKLMGHPLSKKPDGYYKLWANCKRELEGAIKTLGHFPSRKELVSIGLGSLSTSIVNYHGGMRAARDRLGVAQASVPDGHWRVWKNCEVKLAVHIQELGHFPLDRELCDKGDNGLLSALFEYHDGLSGARKRMGQRDLDQEVLDDHMSLILRKYTKWAGEEDSLEAFVESIWFYCQTEPELLTYLKRKPRVLRPPKSRPNGYWKIWENVERELRPMCTKLGRFPSQDELNRLDKRSLAWAISTYHGGSSESAERMRVSYEVAPDRYWWDWKNVSPVLATLTEELGHFPSHGELAQAGYHTLSGDIRTQHGGMAAVRERMGAEERIEHGHWSSWETCETTLRGIIQDRGCFPSKVWLGANGYGGLADAISKNHGGFRAVRKLLGHSRNVKPDDYWKIWENVEREITTVILSIGHFPTPQELRAFKKHSLSYAISHHHGGFIVARKQMGYRKLDIKLMQVHADAIAEYYMANIGRLGSFDEFIARISASCRDEEGLLTLLGSSS